MVYGKWNVQLKKTSAYKTFTTKLCLIKVSVHSYHAREKSPAHYQTKLGVKGKGGDTCDYYLPEVYSHYALSEIVSIISSFLAVSFTR